MSGMSDVRADITRWRAAARTLREEHSSTVVLVAASCTAHAIDPGIGLTLLDGTGDLPEIRHHDYNQLFQLCLSPQDHAVSDVDELVVVWRLEDVFERDLQAWSSGDRDALERVLEGAAALGRAVAHCAGSVQAKLIVSDAPVPMGSGLDHRDPAELTALARLQAAANEAFDGGLGDAPVERLRLAALQLATGSIESFDRRNWLMYRQPFTTPFAHLVGRSIADIVMHRTSAAPKVLVLDCDNTIWGGIAVEDGIGALQAGDAFPGSAYRAFQAAAQRLRHRGVLLALVSKNDPETVERAFAEVDGMVLTDADIAGRRVSWNPKPQAIAELANEFNLGLDSFVFVDDSPYEVGAVSEQLPEVRTLLVPEDIEALPDLLAESGWFRGIRVTDDDRERTVRMQAASGRDRAAAVMSHDEFLDSLGLTVHRIEVGPSELTRVTQLVNKTNQFNLTTIRRSESEIAELVADPDSIVLAYAADDRFGEYGIIGVVIVRRDGDAWRLDTVLMSCRVLGRGVETAMLADTISLLRASSDVIVHGRYTATDRNAMVADLLATHEFDAGGTAGEFALPPGRAPAVPDHIEVTSR